MYFTKEDLEKIRKYITQYGVKDSEFDELNSIGKKDWFTIVGSDGHNKRINARTLFNTFLYQASDKEFLKEGIQMVLSVSDLDNFLNATWGNLVYVIDEDCYYSYSKTDTWEPVLKLYVGHLEPEDKSVLWIDLEDNDSLLDEEQDEELTQIKRQIKDLNNKMLNLDRLVTTGVVAGTVHDSYRHDLIDSAEPEAPEDAPEDVLEASDAEKPDTTLSEPTVKCICVKRDTSSNFIKNKQDLVDGEMLFYTDRKKFVIYYDQKFFALQSLDSTGGSGDGISLEDLYNSELEYLVFKDGDKTYKAKVNSDGLWTVQEFHKEAIEQGGPVEAWFNYIDGLLCINEVYCGGEGGEQCACSHNFVELANGSNRDINLTGIYLLYSDNTPAAGNGKVWKTLALEGVIKAGSTFLIRGARCNTDKQSFIVVDSYDMEWYEGSSLISFHQEPASFFLCAGLKGIQSALDSGNLSVPWSVTNNTPNIQGYIDSCGFGHNASREGSAEFSLDQDSDWNSVLFVRWFMLDPSKQANKAVGLRKTTDLWTYINLNRHTVKLLNNIQYYYPDKLKQLYTPQASYRNKDFFSTKTHFNPSKPNMLNITFGIQATDAGQGATRCFNWVSVGYYEEYLEYKKTTDTEWIRVYSITPNDYNNTTDINTFIEHYKRFRWRASDGTWVTTHKCIVHNLTYGEYEYRVGRDEDSSYLSDVLSFTVKRNQDVTSFDFIQVSDQQGFNWQEYVAWRKTADCIKHSETGYDFTVNTGDATQSGNRASEWLDYYWGREALRNKEEMFTIGNNDLCGHDATILTDGNDGTSKYNHINVLRYYTFELDSNNPPQFTWEGHTYPIYSLYSFNYGDFHFVSINSEIAQASSKTYALWTDLANIGDPLFAKNANAAIEKWFEKDLKTWKNTDSTPTNCSKAIVYCHEMPFTIVTWNFMKGTKAREGSHLNILNQNGNYRFSRLFKKYGIKLVIGGHKHTYCLTKPIYDAPEGYINNSHSVNNTVDLMEDVDTAQSRKPVIQVTNSNQIPAITLLNNPHDYARYEVVQSITAPTYVMCQASGYKLVSNKEQPSGNDYTIPWLLSYFKAASNASTPTENVAQHFPMYIRYHVTASNITITAKQVHGVWDIAIDKNTKSYDMNKQLDPVTAVAMTLDPAAQADKQYYAGNSAEGTYTINL